MKPTIRPPVQRRSKETLGRILQAGVDLLIEGGWAAVTVSEVARRAKVSIGTLYGRFESRDALILAIQDRVLADIAWDRDTAFNDPQWATVGPDRALEVAVTSMGSIFMRHQKVLRALTARSHFDAEIMRRGTAAALALGDDFTRVLLPHAGAFNHPEPEKGIRFLFGVCVDAYSRLLSESDENVLSRNQLSWEETTAELHRVAASYLLGKQI